MTNTSQENDHSSISTSDSEDRLENLKKVSKRSVHVISESEEDISENSNEQDIGEGSLKEQNVQEKLQDFQNSRIAGTRDGDSANLAAREKSKKWSLAKYSRQAKKRRAREKSLDHRQLLITHFYKPLQDIEKLLEENSLLRQMINEKMEKLHYADTNKKVTSLPNFLKSLGKSALSNTSKTPKGNRFDDRLKQFSVYLFIVGGRMLYETFVSGKFLECSCSKSNARK
jgi:hypothetical protein